MLHLKKHFTLHVPSILTPARHVVMSPVPDEDDELIQEINNQVIVHDDDWKLTRTPDTEQLDSFWRGVEQDIKNDPEWISFDEVEE